MIDMSAPPAGKQQSALLYMIAFGYKYIKLVAHCKASGLGAD